MEPLLGGDSSVNLNVMGGDQAHEQDHATGEQRPRPATWPTLRNLHAGGQVRGHGLVVRTTARKHGIIN